MGDEHHLTCDGVADDLELHVLGALDPEDEARVAAHLAACAACRHRVDQLTGTVGELLAALPAVEPSPGFVERVASPSTAPTPRPAPPGAPHRAPAPVGPREGAPGRPSRTRRFAVWGAAAAVVVLVAGGLLLVGSWWVGSQRDTGEVATPTTAAVVARRAPLVTADGTAIGQVALTAGPDVDLTMTVDRAPAGVSYDCVVRTADGTVATVGSWTTTDAGPASWYVSLDPGLAPVVEVSLVVPGTGTIATARPA